MTPKRMIPLLFVGLLGFYWLGVEREDRDRMLTGDEPHYMLITESINRYGTVDLTRIMQDRDFNEGVRYVTPHRAPGGRPGTTYSVHHIGLPLLLAPLHRSFGYSPVILVFTLSIVFLCCNLYLYLCELGQNRTLSLFLTLLFALTAPIVFYFLFIFPDPLAVCFTLYAYRQMRKTETSWFAYGLACILTAFLP